MTAHNDGCAAERNCNLRRAAANRVFDDYTTELVYVPASGRSRIFAYDVHMIEGQSGVRHMDSL